MPSFRWWSDKGCTGLTAADRTPVPGTTVICHTHRTKEFAVKYLRNGWWWRCENKNCAKTQCYTNVRKASDGARKHQQSDHRVQVYYGERNDSWNPAIPAMQQMALEW